ncbi:uncharacterized protein BJ212DRAFT_1297032 [Suillus subaureus]|uniref:Uncharacterized protein n=1 Tax=Suillus subaureus TaxID=48587 RepID=A0A9P7EI37_9AGAM|nr:uncharacterized protein BJ212DRAFT_1297032 [Suillus subaureus]KAG1821692.1 hypothetical protein BJ212DRAFT_1297032 [Suillus subaureus]
MASNCHAAQAFPSRQSPDNLIRPIIEDFVAKGYSNTEIVSCLCKHYDTDAYNVLIDLLKKRRSQWGLKSARGQAHTITSIGPAIERVKDYCVKYFVKRKLILHYMNLYHQADVQARKSQHLKRSVYWTLFLHVTIEPFSGHILWIKIWWTNHNPCLICGWYCDTVQALGAMPLVTQSDPGSENNGIANGFKDILEYGFTMGIYNPDDALERFNHVKPHHNIHKILPHGHPNDIFYHAKEYDSCDFAIYAPLDHPVFLLVLQEFSQQTSVFMAELGSTPVTGDNVWNVYADLLMCFQSIEWDEGIRKLLVVQLPLPCDRDNLIGSKDLPIVDLPLFVEGSGPGSDMGAEKISDEESGDAELDFYEFDWTDDELL